MAQRFKTNQLLLSGQDINNIFYPTSNPSGFIISVVSTWNNLPNSVNTVWSAAPNIIEDKKILILTGNTSITFSGLYNGWCGLLETIQSGISSSGYSLSLPSGTKVINSGVGNISLTRVSGAIDMIGLVYNGTTLFANFGTNFN